MLPAATGASWDLVDDVRQLFEFHFMVNAYRAGTIVAVVAGLVGWFVVLRGQTFVSHTLSLVAFPGAAGATLIGIGVAWGYFGFCLATALVIAAIPRTQGHSFSEESAVVGTLQAFALACGFLFVALYHGLLGGVNSLLFGSFLGVTDGQVTTLLVTGLAVAAVVIGIARPLLFASLDPDVAAARGVPTRLLSIVFLIALGVSVAQASQIVGALLVFALVVVPPATAHALTSRPILGMALSVVLALGVTWMGLALAYFSDRPVGFFTTTLAFGAYLLASGGRWLADRPARGARRAQAVA